MDILNYIPTGRKNAITRRELCSITGLGDRKIRELIHEARRKQPILNLSDGCGYYIPDMSLPDDRKNLRLYVLQEESRLKSIGWALKVARATLRNCETRA